MYQECFQSEVRLRVTITASRGTILCGIELENAVEVENWPLSPETQGPVMVEVRGFEPLSEDLQRNGSTCLADRFSFAAAHAHRPA